MRFGMNLVWRNEGNSPFWRKEENPGRFGRRKTEVLEQRSAKCTTYLHTVFSC
jgi:hypothetical protein